MQLFTTLNIKIILYFCKGLMVLKNYSVQNAAGV